MSSQPDRAGSSAPGPDEAELARMVHAHVTRREALRAGLLGVGGLGAASLLAACGGGSSSSSSSSSSAGGGGATKGGDLTIVRSADSQGFDKTMVFANTSIWVQYNFWENLTRSSADGKDVVPWLATSWKQSADQLTWTFKLRSDVKFHDGSPMTAKDAKFALDESRSTTGGWEFILTAIDTTTAVDDHTLEIKTKYPWAPLLADLSCPSAAVVPVDYGGKSKADYYDAPVGTGPFVWDTWKKGSKLTLKKNKAYWRKGLPHLDSVTWQVVADDNTRNVQVEGGQADIGETPPFSTVNQLRSSADVAVNLFPSTRTDYLLFNENVKPFDDVHVRRAISYAIDRKALIKTALFGHGTAADSFFMPTVPYYDADTPGIAYDMAKAKTELAASSVPSGFSTTYLAASGDSTDAAIAQVLQSSLKQLGITVKIEEVDPTALHTRTTQQQYSMTHSYWTMDIPDPDELVQFAIIPGSGGKAFYTSYNNPSAISAAQQAEKTFDHAARQKLYTQLQTQAAQDAFMGFLFYQPLAYARSKKVTGFQVGPTGLYDLATVSKSS